MKYCSNRMGWAAMFAGSWLSMSAAAQDREVQTHSETINRPKPGFLRFNEDWSVLRDVDRTNTGDFWDRMKHIPLNERGDAYVSIGGHMRARLEAWDGFDFGAPTPDDDAFVLWRLALHADVHFNDNIRAFVEGKSALATTRELPGGRRTLDVDTLALEQAFVDVKLDLADDVSLTVRPGRQVFSFGKQRLVSPLPWANTLRRWDGISAVLDAWDWQFTPFWSQFVPVRKHDFNQADAQTEFYGIYATGAVHGTNANADVYFLGLDRDGPVTFNGTIGSEQRYTIGGRVFGNTGDSGFDYDVEAAYQFGEVGAGDISAYMFATQLGYTAANFWSAPRFFIGFDYATGDDASGGDVETFNPLFPLAHAYYGFGDFVGRQNAIDFNFGATLKPLDKLTLGASVHALFLENDNDALYNAGGAVVRPATPGASKDIGIELDFTASYAFDRHLTALAGYSHIFAGDFLSDTGSSSDLDFLYLQVQFTF